MRDRNAVKYSSDQPLPPYLYGWQATPDGMAEGQRVALHLPEQDYAPDLQVLKESDPDSYRMVIYSWA
ncbi:MAG: hypothetical protein KDI27_11185 [Gammaproteobacteria bacterium]|nr:hypothetical protein [Gammaproteobacteria bacterium]MCP5416209.1 hypothetical protein [Chromatiaceae bacterium]